MEKLNVILSLPRSILRKAKKIAMDQDRSLSALMVELLTYLINAKCPKNLGSAAFKLVERKDQYTSEKRKHLALLAQDTDLGANGIDQLGACRRVHPRFGVVQSSGLSIPV